jgi:hypothetical protein
LRPERWVSLKQFASDYGKAALLSFSIIPYIKERFYEPLGWETMLCSYFAAPLIAIQFVLVGAAIKQRLMPKE